MARMAMASTASPSTAEMTPAAMRIQMMRLLNWPTKHLQRADALAFFQLVRAVSREALCCFLRRQSGR